MKIFHPDVEIRKEILNQILTTPNIARIDIKKLKSQCISIYQTRSWRGSHTEQHRLSKTKYKEELLKLFVKDPDCSIRNEFVQKTTNVNILNLIADGDIEDSIKKLARIRADKLEKRNTYMKKRNELKTQPKS